MSSDEMRGLLSGDETDQSIHGKVFGAMRHLLRARLDSPVGARHDQGRSKASIRKGKRGEAAAKAVRTATKLGHRVTERYSWLRATRVRKITYPGGDPALSVTTGTGRRPSFRRTLQKRRPSRRHRRIAE